MSLPNADGGMPITLYPITLYLAASGSLA